MEKVRNYIDRYYTVQHNTKNIIYKITDTFSAKSPLKTTKKNVKVLFYYYFFFFSKQTAVAEVFNYYPLRLS